MNKNKGSSLQIVLITFAILINSLLLLINYTISYKHTVNNISLLDSLRVIEVMTIGYYKQEIKDGLLLSDEIIVENCSIYYTVDDMGSTFDINTRFTLYDYQYEFFTKIEKNDAIVKEFKYK